MWNGYMMKRKENVIMKEDRNNNIKQEATKRRIKLNYFRLLDGRLVRLRDAILLRFV